MANPFSSIRSNIQKLFLDSKSSLDSSLLKEGLLWKHVPKASLDRPVLALAP